MRWFFLAIGAFLLAATILRVFVGLIRHDPSRNTVTARRTVFTAIWAGFLLATGIQPPPNIMIKIYAVALVFAGAWLFQYARLLPGRIFERYRDERLYPAVLQAWGVGVATIIFACIVGGVLLLLQSVFPSSAIIIMQIIMCCLAGLGFLGAVTIGIFLAIGMQDEAAMGSLSREPRQP